MQLVDGNLHGCFREHLRAHVVHKPRLYQAARHDCDRFPESKLSGFVVLSSSNDALGRCSCC